MASFTIIREKIKFSGGEFSVRGVSTDDLVALSQGHFEDVKQAVARHSSSSGRINQAKKAEIILDVASHFPAMASEIISRCADEPESVDEFRKLNVMVTVKALDAIYRLTMTDGGVELGKAGRGLLALLEANGLKVGPLASQLSDTLSSAEPTSASSSISDTPTPTDTPSESS